MIYLNNLLFYFHKILQKNYKIKDKNHVYFTLNQV